MSIRFLQPLIALLLIVYTFQSSGAQQWRQINTAGGAGNDYETCIAVDASGNSFVTGEYENTATFDSIHLSGGKWNLYVAKYDPAGHIMWAKTIASTTDGLSDLYCYAIAVSKTGELFLAGSYLGSATFQGIAHTSIAPTEIYITKLDADGSIKWLKTAGYSGQGTYNQNTAFSLALDGNGNCFVTGRYISPGTFDSITVTSPLYMEVFIAKYTNSGDVAWVKTFQGTAMESGLDIAAAEDGTCYICGQFFGTFTFGDFTVAAGDPEQKMFIAKISADGNIAWAKKVGSGGYYGTAKSLAIDDKGSVYITGSFRADISLGSYHFSYNNAYRYILIVAKYSSDGELEWAAKTDGDDQASAGIGICTDSAGNCFVTGTFTYTTTFGKTTLTRSAAYGGFVAKIDKGGVFLWVKAIEDTGTSGVNSIAIAADNTIHVAGIFASTVRFDARKVQSNGGYDIFVSEITEDPSSVKKDRKTPLSYYPNPANTVIHSQSMNNILYDILGRIVPICSDCREILVSSLADGLYVLNGQPVVIKHHP